VTYELKPKDGGTEVTVTQESADGRASQDEAWRKADYEKTWATMLQGLEEAVVH
jgi:hypothetical protein